MSPKQQRKTPAQQRAEEALDRVAQSSPTPTKKALDFLLRGSRDERTPVPDQTQPRPKVDQTQTKPRPATQRTSQPTGRAVAPERDYNRRANSLEREALPAGLFPGASKRLYDALYLRTRGAVTPTRTIQATRRELLAWSGIKNIKTVNIHLRRLRDCGLLKHLKLNGEHEGSVYEVFLPEEANPDQTQTSPAPDPSRKMDSDQNQKMVWVGSGNLIENKDTSADPKTFIKTNTERNNDDEALAIFVSALKKATKDVTGRELSPAEAQRWGELADVLITELKIAAGRTTVSSVPAFLAEHLRRRLWKKEKRQIEAETADSASTAPAPKVNASQCLDCFGTGMWYPEGYEKGVARCRHEKLTAEEGK